MSYDNPAADDNPVGPRRSWPVVLAAALTLIGVAWLSTTDVGTRAPKRPAAVGQATGQVSHDPVVTFHGPYVGYALVPDCDAHGSCFYRFWSTADGGRTWRGFDSPVTRPRQGQRVSLAALGDGVLVETRGRRWYSTNRGRAWTAQLERPSGYVRSLPAASLISTRCQDEACLATDVYVTLPTGGLTRLARSPELTPTDTSWRRVDTGTIRVPGLDRAGQPTIATSDDRGRTWQYLRVPSGPLRVSNTYVTSSGSHLFVTVRGVRLGHAGDATGGPRASAFVATADGGKTWNRTPKGLDDPTRVGVIDDRLIVLDGHSLMVSGDSGATFDKVDGAPSLRTLDDVGGAFVGLDSDGAYHISTDGISWRALSLHSLG